MEQSDLSIKKKLLTRTVLVHHEFFLLLMKQGNRKGKYIFTE